MGAFQTVFGGDNLAELEFVENHPPGTTLQGFAMDFRAGDDYSGDRARRINITGTGADLSGKKVQLQGWLNDLVQISHEVDILGTPGSHYILLDPETATTATWPPNYYLGLLRIKHDATTFQTIWEGTLRIHAFPTPGI
ncbi:hypothetical protein [Crateriforma conspicua]|uniref:Uncharacterized protein n=1 Tax=Crateriforma conspicua TaxID=2527996 RepID=A0A5C5XSI7_9PLAN|nr:hypothetical protein [Crateriforma conspicua]QDV66238.1 hypothetical protein Mal65_54140 [Crateriforma conspicua]TWT65628.1 hypothetical protein Pan14r_51750 [Crateriforma conspicua]